MTKTKTTPHGGSKSHHPRGMATATFTGSAPRLILSSSTRMPQVKKLRTAKTGRNMVKKPHKGKVKQVQVSPRVRQVTNPSRLKEEPKHLLKKPLQHQNPPTQNQVPARIPPMPQPRFPPRTPLRPPPKTQMRKPHPTLLTTLKSYKQAGKVWLDTVLDQKEQAYITLFDTLQQLGTPTHR